MVHHTSSLYTGTVCSGKFHCILHIAQKLLMSFELWQMKASNSNQMVPTILLIVILLFYLYFGLYSACCLYPFLHSLCSWHLIYAINYTLNTAFKHYLCICTTREDNVLHGGAYLPQLLEGKH